MKAILIITILELFILTSACFQRQLNVEERISHSGGLSRVNKLCLELPKPDAFILVEKNVRGNSRTYDVGYLFKSDANFDEIKEFYKVRLMSSGWSYAEDRSYPDQLYVGYRRGNHLIFISKIGSANVNYVIQCQEEH